MIDVERELADAVKHFWQTRGSQHEKQGAETGKRDTGNRAAVTGGKHADGFVKLIADIVRDAELPNFEVLNYMQRKEAQDTPRVFSPRQGTGCRCCERK